ncbi:MAG: LapA family protein [Rhodoferax sp.]|nr:LapA family protein [Rhodoferax sp.]
MKSIAWILQWMLKAAIFFTLFAFALNNQSDVTVHFFFGQQWTAPLVLVVLGAFTAGLLIGILGMVPRWWRHRRAAHAARDKLSASPPAASAAATPTPTAPAPLPATAYSDSTLHGV